MADVLDVDVEDKGGFSEDEGDGKNFTSYLQFRYAILLLKCPCYALFYRRSSEAEVCCYETERTRIQS